MSTRHPLFETWDELIKGQVPNFLRLNVNPFVAQTCYCLTRYVHETWYSGDSPAPPLQCFLANSFDEALSGAIKLARFCAHGTHRPKLGLIVDPDNRIGPLASVALDGDEKIQFIPDLEVCGPAELNGNGAPAEHGKFGFVVYFPSASDRYTSALATSAGPSAAPLLIACVSRASLAGGPDAASALWQQWRPDIVVFDESFVQNDVPFGAFAARKELYDKWNKPPYTTFHSTTYQPNSISALHFLRCLELDDPSFFTRAAPHLARIRLDPLYRKTRFARLYNPSLTRATAAVGWAVSDVKAAGHYIHANGQQVFDGVAGVACSIRGHNPPDYPQEIEKLSAVSDYRGALTERLQRLTGLEHHVPGVSGASVVENALKLGLAAQFPRNYVLALRGGFGGKTLLALTGTARESYKERLHPLYPSVLYIDPFSPGAIADLDTAFAKYPVGVVQLELIQAVGGVRAVPEHVVRYLDAQKRRRDYLLFVDEVQTGMYRTGPFLRSREIGIQPDLVTFGKGTSDMMFPFAVTLYSSHVQDKLAAHGIDLAAVLRERADYEFGYKTLLNILDRTEEANAAAHVREQGQLYKELLSQGLASCRAVRDVRVFGLLIGIELNTRAGPRRWLKKQAGSVYVLNMLRHKAFPLFMGYCQYEPHVLKLTPPLSVTTEETRRVCETIVTVLRRPLIGLLPPVCGALARSFLRNKWEAWTERPNHECAER